MEPPLLSCLVLLVFGLLISVFAHRVEAQSSPDGSKSHHPHLPLLAPPSPRPTPPPPPTPPPSPISPPHTPPPPPPPPPSPTPSPPPSPPPPPPPSSAKETSSKDEFHRNISSPPPPSPPRSKSSGHSRGKNSTSYRRAPPPPRRGKSKINAGKKVGLLFSGIAAILQIGVISFLVFKRHQLLKVTNRYETCT